MRVLKRGAAVAVAVAALSAGSISTASAVGSGEIGDFEEVGVLDSAPNCIDAWTSDSGKTAYARNDCSYKTRVKFIWAFGEDSNCFTIDVGETWSHGRPNAAARFDGMGSC